MPDLPSELVAQVQRYTNAPWWNGQAYAESAGYHALAVAAYRSARDIERVQKALRDAKQYEQADALRGIIASLKARSVALLSERLRAKIDAE